MNVVSLKSLNDSSGCDVLASWDDTDGSSACPLSFRLLLTSSIARSVQLFI